METDQGIVIEYWYLGKSKNGKYRYLRTLDIVEDGRVVAAINHGLNLEFLEFKTKKAMKEDGESVKDILMQMKDIKVNYLGGKA